jgi:hypothetical protein
MSAVFMRRKENQRSGLPKAITSATTKASARRQWLDFSASGIDRTIVQRSAADRNRSPLMAPLQLASAASASLKGLTNAPGLVAAFRRSIEMLWQPVLTMLTALTMVARFSIPSLS